MGTTMGSSSIKELLQERENPKINEKLISFFRRKRIIDLGSMNFKQEDYLFLISFAEKNIVEYLLLLGNFITKIEGLTDFKSLTALDLLSNKIEKIEGLENCINLKRLSLQNNNIQKIEGLSKNVELVELSLSSNKIKKIEGLEKLTKLKKLCLNKNLIQKVEGLDNLKELNRLELLNNLIIEIERNLLEKLSKMKVFWDENVKKMFIEKIINVEKKRKLLEQGSNRLRLKYETNLVLELKKEKEKCGNMVHSSSLNDICEVKDNWKISFYQKEILKKKTKIKVIKKQKKVLRQKFEKEFAKKEKEYSQKIDFQLKKEKELKNSVISVQIENTIQKEMQKENERHFKNQTLLRFTSFEDYEIIEFIGGKILSKNSLKGVNSFVFKVCFCDKVFVMKILRIPKEQREVIISNDVVQYNLISKETSEIFIAIKPEFLNFPPHNNVISVYHAFKVFLNKNKLLKLSGVPGDDQNMVVDSFLKGDLPLSLNTGVLIMEYFETNLEEYIKVKNHNFGEYEFLSILHQILEGISHIRSFKFVHRDLKPENIFIKFVYVVELRPTNKSLNLKKDFDEILLKVKVCNALENFNLKEKDYYGMEVSKYSIVIEFITKDAKESLISDESVRIFARKFSIIDKENRMKCVIGDFGCAILCRNGFVVSKEKHKISGSAYYFPREVIESSNNISSKVIDYSKSDIFGIGLTVYSMISKHDPFNDVENNKREQKDYIPITNNYRKETKILIERICFIDKNERFSIERSLKEVQKIMKILLHI